jgi:cephalosporin-C deacetylase-like acetyl esterase
MTLAAGFLSLVLLAGAEDDQWNVLGKPPEGTPANETLKVYLRGLADQAFAKRRSAYEELKTAEQCQAYQRKMREFFRRQIGGLPPRSPLNAQVVGRLEGEDYGVEKIIYESRPSHHVTATFYRPQGNPPFPAVLIACGHSKTGKAADYNQKLGIILAKHGLAALCYDPIGQGERSQILLDDGRPKFGSTTEHSMVGVGAILLGINTAQYRIFDGIRGIDYLVSREDVDGQRIGCTGCSGGGTLTSYIMALDERVTCAAPACYLTTFERLIHTIGPQDAEQNICGQIGFGMDQTDYVLMRAPKPTLICSTTRDFFDIEGSWNNFREAKRFYARLGYPERVDLVEDDDRHGVTKLNRETLTHWMCRWLRGVDQKVIEPEFPVRTVDELRCTEKGEVLLLPDEKSVFDLNAELADERQTQRSEFWANTDPQEARRAIRELAAVRPLESLPDLRVSKVGTVLREGYRVEKLVLEPELGLLLPALRLVPSTPNGEVTLCCSEAGKSADMQRLLDLVEAGQTVCAVDLPGMGETASGNLGAAGRHFGEWKNAFLAYLLGRPLVGIRAECIAVCGRYLADSGKEEKTRAVHLVADGESAIPALHAAALAPKLFASVQLRRMVPSWDSVVRTVETKNQLTNTVHGALAVYDLPDLVRLAGSGVSVQDPVDAMGEP